MAAEILSTKGDEITVRTEKMEASNTISYLVTAACWLISGGSRIDYPGLDLPIGIVGHWPRAHVYLGAH